MTKWCATVCPSGRTRPRYSPPAPSLKLITDVAAFTYREVPKWNPMNVCSYHLQEAGATPEQELAYALATACAVLDATKEGGQVPDEDFAIVYGRISFFVNAGVKFVTELCKMRAFVDLWEEIGRTRYGVTDEKSLRFRYGVQVNSLGLTEPQPENNVYRILIEALAVTLSKRARCRALQLPAWNEAMGLPRPWDQQWSLRLQQILAYETDLLEFEDLFDGSHVIEGTANIREINKMLGWQLPTDGPKTLNGLKRMLNSLQDLIRSGKKPATGSMRKIYKPASSDIKIQGGE